MTTTNPTRPLRNLIAPSARDLAADTDRSDTNLPIPCMTRRKGRASKSDD